MIYIKSAYHSPRLEFILKFIFRQRLDVDFTLTTNNDIPENAFCIDYSETSKANFSIFDSGLLAENEIREFEPEIHLDKDRIRLFPANIEAFTFDFDIFSAVFYLISRYEEYLPYQKDPHGRFDTAVSFAYRNNFHQRALVDEYIIELRDALEKKFHGIVLKTDNFDYRITIDVDMIFSYKGKGFARNTAGWFRDLIKGRIISFLSRPWVLLGLMKDPYDTFEKIDQLKNASAFPFHFFILFAGKWGEFDKNTHRNHKKSKQKLTNLVKNNEVGLHPSYAGHIDSNIHLEEKSALENACGEEIVNCRQHYLKMDLPDTYENLMAMGFTDDYTMGFASIPGYRASTSRPFPFFNLKKNEASDFMVHPFSVMDGSYKDYHELKPEAVLEKLKKDISYLKQINGRFCILIHNETLSETKRWRGWSAMLNQLMSVLKSNAR